MAFENLNFDDDLDKTGEAPPEETGNRTFLVIAGVLGAIAVLALVSIAAYAMMILPGQRSARESYQATLDIQNTEVANIINMTSTTAVEAANSIALTSTAASLLPSSTPTASPTSVLAVIVQNTATPTMRWEMATATVLNATIMANAEQYSATSTARAAMVTQVIPDTGFADDAGLPALFGMSLLLAGVILVARRLRSA